MLACGGRTFIVAGFHFWFPLGLYEVILLDNSTSSVDVQIVPAMEQLFGSNSNNVSTAIVGKAIYHMAFSGPSTKHSAVFWYGN